MHQWYLDVLTDAVRAAPARGVLARAVKQFPEVSGETIRALIEAQASRRFTVRDEIEPLIVPRWTPHTTEAVGAHLFLDFLRFQDPRLYPKAKPPMLDVCGRCDRVYFGLGPRVRFHICHTCAPLRQIERNRGDTRGKR